MTTLANNQFAMNLFYIGLFLLIVGILWFHVSSSKDFKQKLEQKEEQFYFLSGQIEELKKPKIIWCDMHGEKYCADYAAPVLITHDGFVLEPKEEDRVLRTKSDLHRQNIIVELGAPTWKFVSGVESKVPDRVLMLGAMYTFPKKKVIK